MLAEWILGRVEGSYTTAGDGQIQEVLRTVCDHLLKALHIQTKVLDQTAPRKLLILPQLRRLICARSFFYST